MEQYGFSYYNKYSVRRCIKYVDQRSRVGCLIGQLLHRPARCRLRQKLFYVMKMQKIEITIRYILKKLKSSLIENKFTEFVIM